MTRPAYPDAVELRLVRLPTLEGLASGHDRAPGTHRELVIVRVSDTDGHVGWGECSALNRPTYTAEWARDAYEFLAVAPLSEPIPWSRPMAAAGIEMALTDLRLRSAGQSLAASLGVMVTSIPAGAAVGLAPLTELVERVDALVADGFGRIKLKIEPGHDLLAVGAIRERHPHVDLQVDANGSYEPKDQHVLHALAAMGVTAIEQPFAVDDLASARALVEAGAVVIGDEAIGNLDDAKRLHGAGALNALSLKASRVGGLEAAVQIHDWAVANDVGLAAGGMLECGLGRHSLAAFAGLRGFTITGDLSPARRWLAEDPWPDLVLERGADQIARIMVPTGPGVAPPPDLDLLDHFTMANCSRPW